MKLLLTDDDGNVLRSWSIGFEYDYDVEDLYAEGEHDIYLIGGIGEDREIGYEVLREIDLYRTGR